MNTIPTGFQNEIAGAMDKKLFECPICLCLIRRATELECHHLMCEDCLVMTEQEEMEKVKKYILQN